MLTLKQKTIKRSFDIVLSFIALAFGWPIILLLFLIATLEARRNGFFLQRRVGKNAKIFMMIKIRTMIHSAEVDTHITTSLDPRITKIGAFFRRSKLDELPQLLNVLLGEMSFVGPRPDVEGYADLLVDEDRIILSIAPGITGPASLKYKNEEELLAQKESPSKYNDEVVWPDKVKINKAYIENWSFLNDLEYLIKTFK